MMLKDVLLSKFYKQIDTLIDWQSIEKTLHKACRSDKKSISKTHWVVECTFGGLTRIMH